MTIINPLIDSLIFPTKQQVGLSVNNTEKTICTTAGKNKHILARADLLLWYEHCTLPILNSLTKKRALHGK